MLTKPDQSGARASHRHSLLGGEAYGAIPELTEAEKTTKPYVSQALSLLQLAGKFLTAPGGEIYRATFLRSLGMTQGTWSSVSMSMTSRPLCTAISAARASSLQVSPVSPSAMQ